MENRQLPIRTRDRFLYAEDNKKRYKNKKEKDIMKMNRGQKEQGMTSRRYPVTAVTVTPTEEDRNRQGSEEFPPTRTTRMVLTEVLKQALFETWWSSLKNREKEGNQKLLLRKAFNAGLNRGTECVPDRRFL